MIIKWNSLLNGGKKRKQFLIVSCFRNEGKYKRNSRFEVKSQITCSVLRSYVIFLLPLHLWWEYFIDLLFENLYRQKYFTENRNPTHLGKIHRVPIYLLQRRYKLLSVKISVFYEEEEEEYKKEVNFNSWFCSKNLLKGNNF